MIIDKIGQPELYDYLLRLGLIEPGMFFGQLRADLTPTERAEARGLIVLAGLGRDDLPERRRRDLRDQYEYLVSRRLLSDFEAGVKERISAAWLHHRLHHGEGHISECRRCGPCGPCRRIWQTCENLKHLGWW